MQETRVQSLGQEDPLEEGMATHSSILVWRILWTEEPWQTTVNGVAKNWTRLKQVSSSSSSRDDVKYTGRCALVICKYQTILYKGLEQPLILVLE